MNGQIPHIFERELYLKRQQRGSHLQNPLVRHLAEDLADRLSVILHKFEKVLLISQHTAEFFAVLKASGKCGEIVTMLPPQSDALGLAQLQYNACFSMLDLQCVNDVPGYLAQCARSLKPDGLFILSCFGGDTLFELRESWLHAESQAGAVTPRIAPMLGVRELGGLLQRVGLALPVTDSDQMKLRYADALALLKEIKAFGFSNPLVERRKSFTPKTQLAATLRHYQSNYLEHDKVGATLEVIWALAWKPHESQPKPLKPGSATKNLSDILKKFDNDR